MNFHSDIENLEKYRNISIFRILNIPIRPMRFTTSCPFGHKDKTPSFSLWGDNHYHCFSCGKHGKGAIDFCRDMGYSFKEALEELKAYL